MRQRTRETSPGLAAVLKRVGSVRRLARELGVSPQAVSKWKHVPVHRVREIAELTNLSKKQLRPDIYG